MSAALHIAGEAEKPTAEVYTVTPAVAKRWLTRNVRNRALKPGKVNAYARDMVAGNWHMTGEAIKFDTEGALADGQNRLHAVIKANIPVDMLVVRGIAPEAQHVMDSGAKRSASDQLVMAGVKNPMALAATARFALSEPAAGFTSTGIPKSTVTNSEIADFIADHGDALQRAAEIAQHYYPAIDMPPSVLAIAWMHFSNIDVEAAGLFFSGIADMRTDGPGDPRLTLARRLGTIRKNRERLSQVGYLSLIYRAWNAWRKGQSISNLPTHIGKELVKVPERLR